MSVWALGTVGLVLLTLWLIPTLYVQRQASRRQRQIIQEQLLVQARIDGLTRATLVAMRQQVQQAVRDRGGWQ